MNIILRSVAIVQFSIQFDIVKAGTKTRVSSLDIVVTEESGKALIFRRIKPININVNMISICRRVK